MLDSKAKWSLDFLESGDLWNYVSIYGIMLYLGFITDKLEQQTKVTRVDLWIWVNSANSLTHLTIYYTSILFSHHLCSIILLESISG